MFLPVGENTVIDEIFEDFEADDRIDEVFVSTNERFADAFADYLTDSPFKSPPSRSRRPSRKTRSSASSGRSPSWSSARTSTTISSSSSPATT